MKWIVEHNFNEFNDMNIVGCSGPEFLGDTEESRKAICFLTHPKKCASKHFFGLNLSGSQFPYL